MDRTPISFGAWLGIVLLFLFFGVFVLVLIGLSPRGNNYEAKRAEQRLETLKKVQAEANTELRSYAWVDKNKGVVRIPIDRAMELTVTALAQKAPAPANPIETPAAAPQQSPGASPGASPSPAVGTSPQSPATQTGASQPSATPTAPLPSGTPKPNAVQGKDSENRNQPAAAANPPGAQPGTQPGAPASPAAPPAPPSGQPALSPSGTPKQSPPGTPLPVPGKTP